MENTSLVSLSRQGALSRQMDIVANNIANMNTTAFKGEKMMFVQYLVRSKGGTNIAGDKIAFVRDVATVRDTSEGALEMTGNTLDMAIRGEGFFVVQTKAGEQYTRNGHFKLDDLGQLVTDVGDPVLSDNSQPFFFSTQDKDINIARDGTVSTENGDLGKLRVVRFTNEQQLRVVASGLYDTKSKPIDVTSPDIVQNMLESSNIQPIVEMTHMIEVNRAYGAVQDFISREDDRIKKMVEEYGRVI